MHIRSCWRMLRIFFRIKSYEITMTIIQSVWYMIQNNDKIKRIQIINEWWWQIFYIRFLSNHLGLVNHILDIWIVYFPLILHSLWGVSQAEYIMALRLYSVLDILLPFTARVCHLLVTEPLFEPTLTYCWLESWDTLQWNLNHNSAIFIQRNAFKNRQQNNSHLVRLLRVNGCVTQYA